MSLAEAPGLNEGGHFNFEDFNAVVVNNIAGVYFDQHIGQAGNMQRLEDKVKDQKLNPFDPKTYIIHSVRVPQYRLFLNPNLTEDAQIKSFLFNVLRVKTELKRSSTTQLYQTKEQADEADRLDAEKAQRESESFYAEHADLAKDLLKRFLH